MANMASWALCCLVVWSCARQVQGKDLGWQLCEGLNDCVSTYKLEVDRGGNRSLSLSLNKHSQKLVKKCDPETNKWGELILDGLGKANSLIDKIPPVSLVNGNFSVCNAAKTEEGIYKIELLLNESCLAVVNVTVLDPPLPVANETSFDGSTVITTPQENYVAVSVCVLGIVLIPVVICVVRRLNKSTRRPNEVEHEGDPEQLENGSQPHQQEEGTTVI